MATTSTDAEGDKHWTVEEYMALDDDQRYEVYEGELVMTPSPSFSHQRALGEISRNLSNHVVQNELGECLQAPLDVVLAEDTVVQPDLIYVAAERFEELYDGHGFTGAPDLVLEVHSPGTVKRDRTTKRGLYTEAGVSWLVFVDPDSRTVEVFELTDDGRYALAESASDDDSLTIGIFPELSIQLADVWVDER